MTASAPTDRNPAIPADFPAGLRLVESLMPSAGSATLKQGIPFELRVSAGLTGRKPALPPIFAGRAHHSRGRNSYDGNMQNLLAPDALIDRFRSAVKRRIAAERQIQTRFEQGDDPEETRYRDMLAEAEEAAESAMADVHAEYAEVVGQFDDFEASERQRILSQFDSTEARAINKYDSTLAALDREYQEKDWVVDSLIDEQADNSPQRLLEQLNSAEARTREAQKAQLDALRDSVAEAAQYWKTPMPQKPRSYPDQVSESTKATDLDAKFNTSVEETEATLSKLARLKLARWTRGWRSVLWFIASTTAVALPAGMLFDPTEVGVTAEKWWPIAVGVAACFGGAFTAIVTGTGYGSRKSAWNAVSEAFSGALHHHQLWSMRADDEYGSRREKLLTEIEQTSSLKQGKQLKLATRRAERELVAIEERDEVIGQASAERDEAIATLERTLEQQRQQAEVVYNQRRTQTERDNAERIAEATGALQRYLDGRGDEFQRLHSHMVEGWTTAIQAVETDVADRVEEAALPTWEQLAQPDWPVPKTLPNGLQLGSLEWTTEDIEHAVSDRDELRSLPATVSIPATLTFPGNPSVIFRGSGKEARAVAERALQAFLLRAFTSIPPSQMRVTLLDPIGLGEPFSPFMHLTDVDERLVAGRIWTEPQQMEAQLANLTEHMENVLQTYLRGDFATIEAYNEMAGEVAEPYRFLVVNGFPHRFSEPAVRRLLSIASNGPRCGVFIALFHDTAAPAANNLSLDELGQAAEVLVWDAASEHYRVHAKADVAKGKAQEETGLLSDLLGADDALAGPARSAEVKATERSLSLQFVAPEIPAPSTINAIVRNVGEASKDAGRVEVSFTKIAPIRDQRWTSDSRRGLDIPLGRSGATKLQHARFGRGTAQHMLVAGKTGSGKSTFLHALVTNAALHYSPSELRFYLIDFKKGVEFKAYAPNADGSVLLPHADVIAVESEREFGVSALKRLDEVLNERGERFRSAGVQDIGQFRDENPNVVMPRILLLIDEFQEFFVEDDALAQQASLLLDRLIRQGRAFGVHCVLGSQTLGGAYSLARSTLGQIGIRVALQCSEADAHLILAEDNTAARLLARPGEAIYNDAGGLIEGNQHFQVAYLTDEQRENYLAELTSAATDTGLLGKAPVVFEGNKPAVLTRSLLMSHEEGPPRFALGDAVEIKPPTSITLTRRSSGNVLVVGTAQTQTRGILVAAASQLAGIPGLDEGGAAADRPEVFVLHSPEIDEGAWQRVARELGLNVTIVTSTSIPEVLSKLDDVRQSRDGVGTDNVPQVLIVDGLQNFRQLRRPEDDYGFSSGGLSSPFGNESAAPPPVDPGKLFSTLLAEGPERGLFVIASVDGYPAADRALGRKGLREFGTRVLFRLSANDSSSLIDSPAASKLDSLRGLVYDDATGDFEKFRPFAIPKEEELAALASTKPAEPAAEAVEPTSTNEAEPPASAEASDEEPGDASLDDFLVH